MRDASQFITGLIRRKTGETYLSTEQDRAQAPAWVSRSHVHKGRSEGHCRATAAWSQTPERLNPPASGAHGTAEEARRFPDGCQG